jgi:hypothetical protein
MNPIRLFISHSQRDGELVRPLYEWLRSGLELGDHEVRCTSIENITTGNAAIHHLRKDVEAADAVVGLLTSNSLRSHWVGMEMGASWLRQSLFPVRGPGMRASDLPSPLPSLTTVGYCEKRAMSALLRDLAARMKRSVNPQAELDLDAMISTAEQFMRRQIKGWFELPPILSAWRLNDVDFVAPLIGTLRVLHIEDREDIKECAEPTGLIARDPDSLPTWARDHWKLSKLTVNHLLTGTGDFDQIPHGILDESLTEGLCRAWDTAGLRRGKMLHDWMQRASAHIVKNLPQEARSH